MELGTDVAQTFTAAQRGTVTTLTDAATITPDFSASNNFTLTLGGTGRTLANPTNITAGQSGVIVIQQDGTGSRTITSYGSNFKFAGGTAPTLSTGANDPKERYWDQQWRQQYIYEFLHGLGWHFLWCRCPKVQSSLGMQLRIFYNFSKLHAVTCKVLAIVD